MKDNAFEYLGDLMARLPRQLQEEIQNISFKGVDDAARRFVHAVSQTFREASWLHDQRPSQEVLRGDVDAFSFDEHNHVTSLFTPFVERVEVSIGSNICILGDIHGDLHYLVSVLEELQQQGMLDADYRLLDTTSYIGFVGDFTNRGTSSIEVMLVIFYLYQKNLGKVFLLRGNHEYVSSARYIYEMHLEFLKQGGDPLRHDSAVKQAVIAQMHQKLECYNFPDLLYWFDFLPMAVYIGSKEEHSSRLNYMMLCHGGLELGYDPKPFLASDARYECIQKLVRNPALQRLALLDKQYPYDFFVMMLERLTKIGMQAFVDSFLTQESGLDLQQERNPHRVRLGMQWNSFLTENDDLLPLATSQRHRNLLFGKQITAHLLRDSSTTQHELINVVRGHQHLDDSDPEIGLHAPMLSLLRQNQGVVRQWDGMVYTMGDGGSVTGWQAFLMITVGKDKEAWRATHYFRPSETMHFNSADCSFMPLK